jgi:hypothetical protein
MYFKFRVDYNVNMSSGLYFALKYFYFIITINLAQSDTRL